MVKIRLKRMGANKKPFYRIVVADSRSPRDGRFIEEIGYYNPISTPKVVSINEEKAVKWLNNGAQPTDTAKAIEETKKGKVNYRTDSFGNVHGIVGKASFDDAKLVENLKAFVEAIMKVKPSTVKGTYVKNVSISSTMGPGVKIDLNSFDK